jgi:quercetin dioxygenase-like cupin family protein
MKAELPLSLEAITAIPDGADRLVLIESDEVFVGVKLFKPGEVFANHYHEGYDEIFMGIEGVVTVWQGRSVRVEVRPGSSLSCMRGSHHYLVNETNSTAKILYAKVPMVTDDTHWVDWTPESQKDGNK